MSSRQVMEWRCDRCRDVAVTESATRPEGWAVIDVDRIDPFSQKAGLDLHLCSACVNSFDLFLEGCDVGEIATDEADAIAATVHATRGGIPFDGPEQDPADRLYLDLKGAREKLCHAQTGLASRAMSGLLDTAVACIDRVGEQTVPEVWSKYDRAFELTPIPSVSIARLMDEVGAVEAVKLLVMSVRPADRLDVLQSAMKHVLGRVEEQADAVIRRLDPDLPPPAMR